MTKSGWNWNWQLLPLGVLALGCLLLIESVWAAPPVVIPSTVPSPAPSYTAVEPEAPSYSDATDDPARVVLSGSVEYQHHFVNMIEVGSAPKSATGGRIKISFEPVVSFLPASITIDLDSGHISQADLTLIRLWIVNLLSYHRNTDANVGHDIEVLSANVPVFTDSFGGEKAFTSMVVTVGAAVGYRWLADHDHGAYLQPTAGVMATTTLLNRIMASAYLRGSATAMGGDQDSYLSGQAGAQLAFALNKGNSLRLVLNGSVRYDGANEGVGLPDFSQYLGAGIEWGTPAGLVAPGFGWQR